MMTLSLDNIIIQLYYLMSTKSDKECIIKFIEKNNTKYDKKYIMEFIDTDFNKNDEIIKQIIMFIFDLDQKNYRIEPYNICFMLERVKNKINELHVNSSDTMLNNLSNEKNIFFVNLLTDIQESLTEYHQIAIDNKWFCYGSF
jgi:hypothetical protein